MVLQRKMASTRSHAASLSRADGLQQYELKLLIKSIFHLIWNSSDPLIFHVSRTLFASHSLEQPHGQDSPFEALEFYQFSSMMSIFCHILRVHVCLCIDFVLNDRGFACLPKYTEKK